VEIETHPKETVMERILNKNAALAGMLLMICGHFTWASAAVSAIATAFCLPGNPVVLTSQTYTTSPTDVAIVYSIGNQADFFDPDDVFYTGWYYVGVPVDATVYVGWNQNNPNPVSGYYSVTGFPAYVLQAGYAKIYMPSQDASCPYSP
jgi:hypothetical protein